MVVVSITSGIFTEGISSVTNGTEGSKDEIVEEASSVFITDSSSFSLGTTDGVVSNFGDVIVISDSVVALLSDVEVISVVDSGVDFSDIIEVLDVVDSVTSGTFSVVVVVTSMIPSS